MKGESHFRTDVVVTSIGSGQFLNQYAELIEKEELESSVRLVVIADLNTPPELVERCQRLAKKGLPVVCPSIEEQQFFCSKLGIESLIPFRTDNRRNIGFLMTLESDADFLISVDDDNFPREASFFREHAHALGTHQQAQVTESASGWFNICSLADCSPRTIYPRGFPYEQRKPTLCEVQVKPEIEVHANAGLWMGDPDVDAVTRIAYQPVMNDLKKSVILGQNTWTPINTQNTAIHRKAIPAYYYLKMIKTEEGFSIDRYGDILSGYFVQKCIKHHGHAVRAGSPLVFQERNEHYLLKDLHQESIGMLLIEDLYPWLMEVSLSGSSYNESYLSLSYLLEEEVSKRKGYLWTKATRTFCFEMAKDMRDWLKAVRQVLATSE